ncbi:MAG: uroporphyrinogen decarboxylase family protein [Clostridiales bacterium]|nr:uroporphyrinogen decarboxylase family protein [Clostridiales bacterium]
MFNTYGDKSSVKPDTALAGGIYGKVLEKHRAFWEHRPSDRPLLGCNIGMFVHHHCPLTMKGIPEGIVKPDDINVQLFLEDCENLYLAHKELGDDYPFIASPFVFIPWMEAIMGCPVRASESSIWAEPCVNDWETWEWKSIIGENPWMHKLLEIIEVLVKHAAGRFPVSATMMRGPSDILAAMRGAGQLPLDMLDYPDRMRNAVRLCADAFIEIGKEQLKRIPDSDEGYMDGDRGFRVWAPERLIWLQEDAMALLSPQIYREFFLPEDRRICNAFAATAFHLHGSALWMVDDLIASPEMDVIELNLEAANCDVEGTFKAWKKIRQYKPLVIWRLYDEDFWAWLDKVLNEIPAQGLSLQVTVMNLEEGKKVKSGFLERTR